MNFRNQIQWWNTFSRFQKSREATWLPVINKALQKQIRPTITILKEQGISTAMAWIDRSVDMEPVERIVKNIYVDAGRVWGAKTYQMVKQQAERLMSKKVNNILLVYDNYFDTTPNDIFPWDEKPEQKRLMPIGFNEDLINDILAYYRLFLLTRATIPITQSTQQDILNVLTKAQQEGWSIQQVVDRLESPELTRARSRMIARTETGKSSNWASVWGARKTGYATQKIWIAARDQRTRRTPRDEADHLRLNGVTIELNEKFHEHTTNGVQLMDHPCDVNAPASSVINCRCCLGYRVKKDNAGRPLRS